MRRKQNKEEIHLFFLQTGFKKLGSQGSGFLPDIPVLANVAMILWIGGEKALGIKRSIVLSAIFEILNHFHWPIPGPPFRSTCVIFSSSLSVGLQSAA